MRNFRWPMAVLMFGWIVFVSSCALLAAKPEPSAEVVRYEEITDVTRSVLVTLSIENTGTVSSGTVYISYTYATNERTYYRSFLEGNIPAHHKIYVTDTFDYINATETRSGQIGNLVVSYE